MASPTLVDSQGNLDIVGARAVVEWTTPTGQTCYLCPSDSSASEATHITFDLHFRPATSTASLRLRVPIMLKGLGRKMTPLFLFIPPERIRSLALVSQEETQPSEYVQKELGGAGAVSLRFELAGPGNLIAPPHSPVVPKKKVFWDLLDSMKLLAHELDFVVHLSQDKLPSEESARSMGDALSAGKFATSIPHADISRLYDGNGGKLLTGSDLIKPVSVSEPVDSPPSYDELGPGPPAPPIKEGPQHTIASSSSSNRKRRRRSSSSSSSPTANNNNTHPNVDTAQVEAICRKMMSEVASQWRAEGEHQLRSELQALESRMREWVDVRLRKHADDLKEEFGRASAQQQNHLEDAIQVLTDEVGLARDETQDTMDKIDEVKEEVGKAKEETEELVDGRVDERAEVLRAELEEYVADQVHEAEDRVIDRLRSSVFIDFNIYDS